MIKPIQKKADISLNMIIIAVIALVVLIVILVIFSGKFNIFGKSVTDESGKYSSNNCVLPGSGRTCKTGCDPFNERLINPPLGGWKDCKSGDCCET
ncbi:hypothetical protein ACFL0W_05160 [Nanoarchaeota archaeon]